MVRSTSEKLVFSDLCDWLFRDPCGIPGPTLALRFAWTQNRNSVIMLRFLALKG